MTWVRLDEDFPRHPKIAAAGPLGLAMQVAALCYCNQYLTDGFVPKSVAQTLLDLNGLGMHMWSNEMLGGGEDANAGLVIADVLAAGLWDEVPGGYQIHDYFEYQPSKAEVLEMRAKRVEAGKLGGQARAKQRAKQTPSKRSSKPVAKSSPVPVPDSVLDQRPIELSAITSIDRLLEVLTDATTATRRSVISLGLRYALSDNDYEVAREAALSPSAISPSAVAVSELKKRGQAKEDAA